MNCDAADAFIHTYVDGELQGVDRDTYERHIFECDKCFRFCRLQARFKASIRGHLPRPDLPAALRRKIEDQLAASPPPQRRWPWQLYPRFVPAFAAATVLVVLLVNARRGESPIFAQALRTYQAAGMPMDVKSSDCRYIADWFREHLDFAVKPPPLSRRGNCQGGRILNVQDRFIAYFVVYSKDGANRLGVFVVDSDEPLQGPVHREVNGYDVYFDSRRGASSMAFRDRDGLTYVVTGDVDTDVMTSFLPASYSH